MYVTTDKDLFNRWLSDLAGKAVETCLQRRPQNHSTERESYSIPPRRAERPGCIGGSEPEAPAGIDPAAAGLSRQQRIILALRDGGLTYEEIASHLGIPAGTVHSRLFRARRRMTDAIMTRRLAPAEDDSDDDPSDRREVARAEPLTGSI